MSRIIGEDKTYTKSRISRKALREEHKKELLDKLKEYLDCRNNE